SNAFVAGLQCAAPRARPGFAGRGHACLNVRPQLEQPQFGREQLLAVHAGGGARRGHRGRALAPLRRLGLCRLSPRGRAARRRTKRWCAQLAAERGRGGGSVPRLARACAAARAHRRARARADRLRAGATRRRRQSSKRGRGGHTCTPQRRYGALGEHPRQTL
ncbi:hypothetical protein T492DRAFT_902090, partial [Pavlovales sp. CCMP2436]